ncbi:uncharacterized protein LOC129569989 [Sitodiplosis mosellana]|uniref:uncharacterized protein LOC129569989 n=1 Tax=Sitodiplosis mosellana TaxID=263140 RepID=UPI0024452065|nr:uncharacterized protein LOC129569989 [Sitodiplosis mosellana]
MSSYTLQILTWIFVLSFICLNVQCKEILANYSPNYRQLDCKYDLPTSDQICDCTNRNKNYFLPLFNGNINNLKVQNCKNVLVTLNTFRDVDHIEHIHFTNIKELTLEAHSLGFKRQLPVPKIKLIFTNVYFSEIVPYSIGGGIDSITFNNCYIKKLNAYAINSVYETVYLIAFENTGIDVIESQALKKLDIEHFIMRNTTIWSHFPSRAFSALTITHEISISNCTFATISSHAIELDHVSDFIFSNNKVDLLDGEAFQMNANGRILIERNNFTQMSHSALSAINVDRPNSARQRNMEIQFTSNDIFKTDHPIRFDLARDINIRILNLKFSNIIDCDKAKELRNNGFLQQYAETIYFRIGTPTDGYSSLSSILSNRCANTTYLIAIISVAIVLLLILVIVGVAIFYRFWWMKRKPNQQISMIIPDGKTYRETQIMIQIENAGLLKTNL